MRTIYTEKHFWLQWDLPVFLKFNAFTRAVCWLHAAKAFRTVFLTTAVR